MTIFWRTNFFGLVKIFSYLNTKLLLFFFFVVLWQSFVCIFTQIKVMILLYTMTSHELAIAFFYWTCFFMLYFLRKIPPFTTIWKYTMIFFAVLVGTVWYNKWKEKNK